MSLSYWQCAEIDPKFKHSRSAVGNANVAGFSKDLKLSVPKKCVKPCWIACILALT